MIVIGVDAVVVGVVVVGSVVDDVIVVFVVALSLIIKSPPAKSQTLAFQGHIQAQH